MISPALSPGAWATIRKPLSIGIEGALFVHAELVLAAAAGEWHSTMALANAALDDGDPRKLTWATVDRLPHAEGEGMVEVDAAAIRQLRALLEALLAPRAPAPGSA